MRNRLFRSATLATAGTVALAAGCKEATSVQDLNNLPANTIASGLTPSTFQLLTTGVINSDRANVGFRFIVFSETMARDVYNLDPSESRFITELLGPQGIDPSAFSGGSAFLGFYNTIATINTVLGGLAGLGTNYGFTSQQISASTGFLQTYKALELYHVFETRGPNGLPADAATSVNGTLSPLLCQTSALARISALLDSGYTNLQNGGTSFPFTLPGGFTSNGNFATPAGFAKFNRGLKAKAELYRGVIAQNGNPASPAGAANFTAALAALQSSFINPTGDLTTGVYYQYVVAPNEQVNPIAAPTVYLNQAVGDSIQPGDLRAAEITKLSKPRTLNRVTTNYTSPLSSPSNQTGPIPILRNAELVLVRAQAEIGLGQLAAATSDINAVRTVEGGPALAAYSPFTSAGAALNADLYEKRYSLLLTGAQRLVDLRSYNLLNATNGLHKVEITLPAPDQFNTALPIPKQETDARGGNVSLTCS